MLPSERFYQKTDRRPNDYVSVTEELISDIYAENVRRRQIGLSDLVRIPVNRNSSHGVVYGKRYTLTT